MKVQKNERTRMKKLHWFERTYGQLDKRAKGKEDIGTVRDWVKMKNA